jgi:hypothetical protein
MKKTLTLVVLILTPTIILAQGTVNFVNSSTSLVQKWTGVYDSTLMPVSVGGGYVQFIAAPKNTTLWAPLGSYDLFGFQPNYTSLAAFLAANPGWAVASAPTEINVGAGLFNGGTVTVNGISPGADADYLVIGWTGPYSTYDAAFAASRAHLDSSFLGTSAIATTATGNPTLSPPGTPVSLSFTFPGFTLAPLGIPEPTTVLLAGLGAVVLLVFRRRNCS